jgi:hypothetical protein
MGKGSPFEITGGVDKRESMAQRSNKKWGGGEPSGTEIVTVRLDPKLRYLVELAARKQRCTLSSFIEWAVEDSLNRFILHQADGSHNSITVQEDWSRLWDVDETERFARLAILYPDLLSYREQEIWKLLNDSLLLDPAKRRNGNGNLEWDWGVLEDKIFPMLRHIKSSLMLSYVEGDVSAKQWVESMREKISKGEIYPDYCQKEGDEFRE